VRRVIRLTSQMQREKPAGVGGKREELAPTTLVIGHFVSATL